jgi:hypothetical protein
VNEWDIEEINPLDEVQEKDLDIRVSFALVMTGSLGSFIKIRAAIENYFETNKKKREKLIHGTASSQKLFILKESELN